MLGCARSRRGVDTSRTADVAIWKRSGTRRALVASAPSRAVIYLRPTAITPSTCVDETTITLFLDRQLPAGRATGIETHIDRCATCRRLLSELARDRAPISDDSTAPTGVFPRVGSAERSTPALGDRVDRYVLLRVIGSGGMGTVYAAYDPDLDREIAVKLLRRTGTPDSQARLVREAQAMARVSSPNVVAVHDVGTFRDQVYIAMELVAGGTLKAWLHERPRGWREIVRVLEAAGRGLAAAHARGLIHRDFKPDNVLIDGDRVRVADLGLAAPLADVAGPSAPVLTEMPSAIDRLITVTGAIVGTPAYMAPEQLSGDPVDGRADQFSFCVTLYEALLGARPFAGETITELVSAIHASRVRVPQRSVPTWLRAILARGLSVDRDARFASMDVLLAQLERGRRRRQRVALAAAALVAIGGTAASMYAVTPGSDPCAGADTPPAIHYDGAAIRAAFARLGPDGGATADRVVERLAAWRTEAAALRGAACHAARVEGTESAELLDLRMACVARSAQQVEALARVLAVPTPKLVEGAVEATARATELTTCSSPRALLEPLREPAEPASRALAAGLRAQLASAKATAATGRYPETIARASEIARAAAATGHHAIEAEAWQVAGTINDDAGSFLQAREALQRALVASEAAGDDRRRGSIYLALAVAENKLDRRADARRWVAQARALSDHLALESLQDDVAFHEGLAAVWEDDYATAIVRLRAATADHERRAGDDLGTMKRLLATGIALFQHDDMAEADRVLRRSLALGERLLGDHHPALINPLTMLASIAIVLGRPSDALVDLRRAFVIAEASGGAQLARVAAVLGAALGQAGKFEEAVGYLDRGLVAYKPAVGDDSGQYATMLGLRGKFLTDLGRHEAALADHVRAVEILRARLGPDNVDLATALEGEGRTLQALERYDESIRDFTEALRIRGRASAGSDRSLMFFGEQGIGLSLMSSHRQAQAIPHFEHAIALRSDGGEYDPGDLADAQVDLARALLELDRDRGRAIALLRAARKTFQAIEGGAERASAIATTLDELGVKEPR